MLRPTERQELIILQTLPLNYASYGRNCVSMLQRRCLPGAAPGGTLEFDQVIESFRDFMNAVLTRGYRFKAHVIQCRQRAQKTGARFATNSGQDFPERHDGPPHVHFQARRKSHPLRLHGVRTVECSQQRLWSKAHQSVQAARLMALLLSYAVPLAPRDKMHEVVLLRL